MAQQTPGYVISAATHSAALFRQAFDAPFLRRGMLGPSEYQVAQQASPNMSVQVSAGRAAILGTQGVTPAGFAWTTQGSYFVENDAAATVTIAASNPSNPRIDVVYVAVQDAFYSGASNQVVLAVATGVPSGSPAIPAIPVNAIACAYVAVGAAVSTIITANITQVGNVASAIAIGLGGVLPVTSSLTYPTTPYDGQVIYDQSSDTLYAYNGTSWRAFTPACARQMSRNTTASIVTATTVGIAAYTSTVVNVGDIAYASGIFTIVTPGVYRWGSTVGYPSANGAKVASSVLVNGASVPSNSGDQFELPGAAQTFSVTGGGLLPLVASDTVQATVFQNTGGTISVTPWSFELVRLA